MNYAKLYDSIVLNAKFRQLDGVHTEKHHIVPKCLDVVPDNRKANLVVVTYREHFLLHCLLCKILPENFKLKLALSAMQKTVDKDGKKRISSRQIDILKRIAGSSLGKQNIGNVPWNRGKKNVISDEARLKMSLAKKGKPTWNKGKTGIYSPEKLKRQSEIMKLKTPWNKGKKMSYSEEHIQKIVDTQRERFIANNPMNDPEIRLKLSLSKIGRKRFNMPDGTFKMIYPEINNKNFLNTGKING